MQAPIFSPRKLPAIIGPVTRHLGILITEGVVLLFDVAPVLGGMIFGLLYAPLVIETVSVPLGSPIDKLGRFVQLAVPVTFSTLTAWDGADWAASNRRYT